MANSDMAVIQDNMAITQLVHRLAYSQDVLDWKMFQSCWTTTQPLQIDLSKHLSSYSPDLKITTADLARTAQHQLSGFDGTQHMLSNAMIDIDESRTKASLFGYMTAYHFYSRPAEEGPDFVLVRVTWNVSCIKESDGQWKATGIQVARMVPQQGDDRLYELAKAKGESGNGRKALTMWEE